MVGKLLFLFLCVSFVIADDNFEENAKSVALKVINTCSATEDFSECLKLKAITFLDRLGRMKKVSLVDGVNIVRALDVPEMNTSISEEQLVKTLPRSYEAKRDALNTMIMDKVSNFLSTSSLEVDIPNEIEEVSARKRGGKKKKKGGHKQMLLMLIGAKIYTLGSVAIAGLFLLAKKAFIIAKIALLISGIIGLKKLLAAKNGGGGHSGYGGGSDGGWNDGWNGGWDRKQSSAQNLAYKSYSKTE